MLSLATYANPRPNPNPTVTLPLKPHCESQTCLQTRGDLHLVPISVAASSQSCLNLAHTRSLPEKQSAASFIPHLWRLRHRYHDNSASYGLLSCSFSSPPKMHLCMAQWKGTVPTECEMNKGKEITIDPIIFTYRLSAGLPVVYILFSGLNKHQSFNCLMSFNHFILNLQVTQSSRNMRLKQLPHTSVSSFLWSDFAHWLCLRVQRDFDPVRLFKPGSRANSRNPQCFKLAEEGRDGAAAEHRQNPTADTKMWEQILRTSQNASDGNSVFSVDESGARSQFLRISLVFILKRKALASTNCMIAPSSHRNPHGCTHSESAAHTHSAAW